MTETVLIIIAALSVLFLTFILGASVPSLLLWHKTRECRHLLNLMLHKPVRTSNTARILGGGDTPISSNEKQIVNRTPQRTAIDSLMDEAFEQDNNEARTPNSQR